LLIGGKNGTQPTATSVRAGSGEVKEKGLERVMDRAAVREAEGAQTHCQKAGDEKAE
jgi:hypothetical protein